MRIQYSLIARKKELYLEEVINYPKEQIKDIYTLLDMKDVKTKVHALFEGDYVHLDIEIITDLVLECAYTLEPVDYPMHLYENVDLCFQKCEDEDDDIIYVDGDYYDLNQLILSLIITEIPLKVVKEGATLPQNGKGYEVITEEEYERRQKDKGNSQFDILLNDDFDGEE